MSRNTISNAKISRPELTDVYVRQRLIQALKPAPGRQASFVTSPAGWGKTTLLASYLDDTAQACIWYQIDTGDADPATFFYYLGMAARRASPRRRKPMPLLTTDHLPSIRAFARTFFEALFSRLKRPGCLVLDDYHHLPPESPLHELIRENLSLLPGNVQLIIASRQPPPPVFSMLIANRRMQLLGWNELKLTEPECRGILKLHGLAGPGQERITQLMETTDGWVAAVILLLQSGELEQLDMVILEQEFPEVMFDYFASEVFQRLDRETREFLLKTSILSQMTLQTSRALTGNKLAGKILSGLIRNNYFTYRLRGRQAVYEYHALFRRFLLSRARETFTQDQLRTLYLQAAELEKAEQHFDSAAELYAQVGDTDALEALVCEQAASLISLGRFSTLQEWIERIPAERRECSPWLQYWSANCVLPLDLAAALVLFESAFEQFQTHDDLRGVLMAWCGAVDTYIYRWDRFTQLDNWIAWLDAWVSRGSTFPNETIEGHVASSMAIALFYRQPYRNDLADWFDRAWSIAQRSKDPNLLVQTGFCYMEWNLRMGAFDKSRTMLDTLRPAINLNYVSPMLKIMLKHYEAGVRLLEANIEEGFAVLDEALELAEAADIHHQDYDLHSYKVYSALIMGDAEQGSVHLERVSAAMQGSPNLMRQGHYLYLRGWENFVRRNFKVAVEYCEATMEMGLESGCPFALIMPRIGLALSLFDNGQVAQAHQSIGQAVDEARRIGSPLFEYFALFAVAYFKLASGLDGGSLAALREALTLGRKNGFELSALWWHSEMLELMFTTALDAGIEPEFVQANIRCRKFVPEKPPLACRAWPWTLKVLAFGGVELIKDGQPLRFGRKTPKKPLELLKAIVALGGADVPESALIDALWPDSDGDTGRSAFSTTLKRLREIVDGELLTLADGRVSLDRRRCWTDVWAFEDLISRADAADKSGDSKTSIRLADDALALYRGHFLAAEVDASWAISTRERLRSRLLAMAGKVSLRLENGGLWREAVDWYQRGLEIDPLAEEFYQGLMRVYLQLGFRAEAVQTYQRCRQALSLSLGIEPGSATEKLYRQLTAG